MSWKDVLLSVFGMLCVSVCLLLLIYTHLSLTLSNILTRSNHLNRHLSLYCMMLVFKFGIKMSHPLAKSDVWRFTESRSDLAATVLSSMSLHGSCIVIYISVLHSALLTHCCINNNRNPVFCAWRSLFYIYGMIHFTLTHDNRDCYIISAACSR